MGRPRIAGGYDAHRAGKRARRLRRAAWPTRKLHRDGPLWAEVRGLLALRLSPEQIAAKLRLRHPEQPQLQAFHETIYSAIYPMPQGELRRDLTVLLRQARAARRPPRRGPDKRGSLQDMVSIHVRPLDANERLLLGHWEGDLIKGKAKANASALGTLVCRRSLFTMVVKLDASTALDALEGLARAFAPLPPELRQTLTYDQGKEMALHKKLAEITGLKVYFCDPHGRCQGSCRKKFNAQAVSFSG